jgi:hypothetical protein
MPLRRLPIAIVLLAVTLGPVRIVAAQTPTDTLQRTDDAPPRAWLSVGVGPGSSRAGGFVGRAAVSIAPNPVVVFTVQGTGVGSFGESSIDATSLMVGVRAPTDSVPGGFFFGSAGLANTSCGRGCPHETGAAFDAGYHAGGSYAGMSVVAFAVRAPHGSSSSGVVFAFEIGWFGRGAR